jgi:pyruvate kinase
VYILCNGQGVNSELDLQNGTRIRITTNEVYADKCTKENLFVDYKNIVQVIKAGNRIFIDDGLISLLVKEVGSLWFLLFIDFIDKT